MPQDEHVYCISINSGTCNGTNINPMFSITMVINKPLKIGWYHYNSKKCTNIKMEHGILSNIVIINPCLLRMPNQWTRLAQPLHQQQHGKAMWGSIGGLWGKLFGWGGLLGPFFAVQNNTTSRWNSLRTEVANGPGRWRSNRLFDAKPRNLPGFPGIRPVTKNNWEYHGMTVTNNNTMHEFYDTVNLGTLSFCSFLTMGKPS